MEKEKESGALLGVGTTYLQVKEIKGEFYVKASDFNRCMDGIRIEQEADRKHIDELEEENSKLKEEIKTDENFEEKLDNENKKLREENKKLNEDYKVLGILNDEIRRVNEELREENKKLESDLAFERTMLDNVKAEYESLQNVNKKLNIKIASLEGEIKGLNSTIERLRTDNIYEEGLYD